MKKSQEMGQYLTEMWGQRLLVCFFLTCVHVDESDPVQKISIQEESKTGWA